MDENPLLTELRRRLSGPGPWTHRFQRLAKAIAEAAGPEHASPERAQKTTGASLDCEECEGLLDVYVDDELAGHDTRHLRPLVWHHLQTCRRCRQAYDLLAETLRRERDAELAPIPGLEKPHLSFLRPHSADTSWVTRLRPQIAGAPFGLVFSFNHSYLRTLLSPPALAAVRMEQPFPSLSTHLLLSDTVSAGEQRLVVEVTATHHPERPEYMDLQAIITGSAPLPENLWARLTWADQIRSALVDVQGRVEFGEISLTRLQEALDSGEGSFEIAFEAADVAE